MIFSCHTIHQSSYIGIYILKLNVVEYMKKVVSLTAILVIIIAYELIPINKYWGKTSKSIDNTAINSLIAKDEDVKSNAEQKKYELDDKLIDGKWKLKWNDEFDSNEIDKSKWNVLKRKDNYNNELQFYTEDNVIQENGVLSIIGKRQQKKVKKYTSGLIDTRNKFAFKYGRIDIRTKNPEGKGLFPAIWMMPDNSSEKYPEIDIMEMIGQEPFNIYGVVHYEEDGKYMRSFNNIKLEDYSGYHIYSFEWNESNLKWYVDGKLFHSTSFGVPHEKMYIIINLAIGGNWPGHPNEKTIFPSDFIIDYVRVYKEYKN